MSKIKYNCPACGLKVFGEEGFEYMPSKRLDLCRACNIYDRIVPILGVLFFAIAIVILFLELHLKQVLILSGLSLDISGVILLFGKMERPVIVSGLMRGEEKDPLEIALPKHVWQTRAGLVLVVTGFIFQAIAFLQ